MVLKAKLLEEKYEAKLEFPRGGGGGVREGCKTKDLPWGEHGYFLDLHIGETTGKHPFRQK